MFDRKIQRLLLDITSEFVLSVKKAIVLCQLKVVGGGSKTERKPAWEYGL